MSSASCLSLWPHLTLHLINKADAMKIFLCILHALSHPRDVSTAICFLKSSSHISFACLVIIQPHFNITSWESLLFTESLKHPLFFSVTLHSSFLPSTCHYQNLPLWSLFINCLPALEREPCYLVSSCLDSTWSSTPRNFPLHTHTHTHTHTHAHTHAHTHTHNKQHSSNPSGSEQVQEI